MVNIIGNLQINKITNKVESRKYTCKTWYQLILVLEGQVSIFWRVGVLRVHCMALGTIRVPKQPRHRSCGNVYRTFLIWFSKSPGISLENQITSPPPPPSINLNRTPSRPRVLVARGLLCPRCQLPNVCSSNYQSAWKANLPLQFKQQWKCLVVKTVCEELWTNTPKNHPFTKNPVAATWTPTPHLNFHQQTRATTWIKQPQHRTPTFLNNFHFDLIRTIPFHHLS